MNSSTNRIPSLIESEKDESYDVRFLRELGFYSDGDELDQEYALTLKHCKNQDPFKIIEGDEGLQLVVSLKDYSIHLETYDNKGASTAIIELPKKPTKYLLHQLCLSLISGETK